jgi:hypothetical protein
MNSRDADQKIEAYLDRLRAHLGGMKKEDAREIIQELRSHLMDKLAGGGATAGDADSALAALGSPEELAAEYLTDYVLARAETSRSPLRILASLFRWAGLSVAGFFVLLSALIGYFLGAAFALCALLKPFHPQTAGLWLIPDGAGSTNISLRLGFGSAPAAGREILGWWIVPAGLLVGGALVMLTTRFAVWTARRYRKSRGLPRG